MWRLCRARQCSIPTLDLNSARWKKLRAYRKAVGKLRSLVAASLHVTVKRVYFPYLLAAMAATSGQHLLALGLIHAESVITCPKCGNLEVRCPRCGKAFQCWPELFA